MISLIRAHGAMDYVSIDLSIVADWHIIPDLSTKRMKLQEKVEHWQGVEDMIIWFKSFQIMLICQLADSPLEI